MKDAKEDPNCMDPACRPKMDLFRNMMGGPRATNNSNSNSTSTKATAAHTDPLECPWNRDELGNATWGMLHSMGAYYPEKPSSEYQQKMKNFIEALALMFPCKYCAKDFETQIAKSPPRVDSRQSISMWLCEQHNHVNKKVGKPLFQCTMEKLNERWRTGNVKCWDGHEAANSLGHFEHNDDNDDDDDDDDEDDDDDDDE